VTDSRPQDTLADESPERPSTALIVFVAAIVVSLVATYLVTNYFETKDDRFDILGLRPQSEYVEFTPDEQACMRERGVLIDLDRRPGGPSPIGPNSSTVQLNATLTCVPRIVNDPTWLSPMTQGFVPVVGVRLQSQGTNGLQCVLRYAMIVSDRPGDVYFGDDPETLVGSTEECSFSSDVRRAILDLYDD